MRKLTVAAGAFAAAMFIAVPVGAAATPQQIYRDYADNGRLDGHYSKSDLQRALQDAVVQGYTPAGGGGFVPAAKKKSSQASQPSSQTSQSGTAGAATAPVQTSGGLPFTGLDLTLIAIGGVLLLAFGVSLRRFARRTS
ncbi:MAG: hypothetical protein C5B48_08850 [Candidatus Rokuibacteriota bacterium]|nr:MAG: hypothetical protein C5B48_08850 [Candidatus Rokubacteria bacterium]